MDKSNFVKIIFFFFVIQFIIVKAHGQEKNINRDSSKEYSLDDCVNEFDMNKSKKTKSGYLYWFADKEFTEGRTIKMSVVNPNQATHAPHSHSEDEFFFVLEGTAKFYLNGETIEVGPNTSLYCPSNSEHGISNPGSTVLKYLVIKKYPKVK